MSQENVEVVRRPLPVRKESKRTLDQQLMLRFPWLTASYVRLIGRLSPVSRLRQAAIGRGVRLGLEAYNRRDLEAAFIGWDPGFELHPGREWVEDGLVESCYRGVEGFRRYAEAADRIAGGKLYLRTVELIDFGARLLILADAPADPKPSDAPASDPFASLAELEDGRVIRAQEYFDHPEALEAARLRE
jgi:ketosteroid isomerase-like protein